MKKGFTLVELLVVIAIIGILATIIMINYSAAQVKARNNKRKSDIQSISGALGLFYADKKAFPGGNDLNISQDVGSSGVLNGDVDAHGNLSSYISAFPVDPFKSDCHYLYFAIYEPGLPPDIGQPAKHYKLASIAAEDMGNNVDDCKRSAGEYEAFGNYDRINDPKCDVLQVASDEIAKNANVEVKPFSIKNCNF